MTDLRLELDETGADLLLEEGDLALDEGLETAVVVSLFTDRRVDVDERLPEEVDVEDPPPFYRQTRGFWADTAGDRWGSKLYLLSRAKALPATAAAAVAAVEEALEWLVRAQIVSSVSVDGAFQELRAGDRVEKVLSLEVELHRGVSARWDALWRALEGATFEASGIRVRLLAA